MLIRDQQVPEYFAVHLRASYALRPQPPRTPAPDRIGLVGAALGVVLGTGENNIHDFQGRYPDIYRLLERVHEAYAQLEGNIEHDNQQERMVPRLLIVRTHGAILAAFRVAIGRRATEAYPLLRTAIENAWYALHMAKDPAGTERAEVWLRRDELAKARCTTEFTVANVRATHEGLDATSAKTLHDLYKHMIAFGTSPQPTGGDVGARQH